MSDKPPAALPSLLPSLARTFEGKRESLRMSLQAGEMSAPSVVTAARRALDATGAEFVKQTDDVAVQKAALWLIEMVKAGAGVLDSGARAEIIWREVPKPALPKIAGSTLFYGAATVFGVAGLVQGSRLTILCAGVLILLRAFDPKDWTKWLSRLPFLGKKKPNIIEGPDGRKNLADARVIVDSTGFVDGLADALRTADHILARLSQPIKESHWRDDSRVIGLMQNLLEAKLAGDGEFALRVIETELGSVLRSENIEIVEYSRGDKRLFDVLPALELETESKSKAIQMAAPALISGEHVLRRGSVWTRGKD